MTENNELLHMLDQAIEMVSNEPGYVAAFAFHKTHLEAMRAALAQQPQGEAQKYCSDERPCINCFADNGQCLDAPVAQGLTEDDVWLLASAAENLRSADKTERRVEAAFRIAAKLDELRKRLALAAPAPGASPADQVEDARYPEGFDESCGIEARFMRAANAALCDMTGNRQWDVPCLATHIKSMSATPESQEGDA